MSQISPPLQAEDLRQLPTEKLIEIILAQESQIAQLTQEIEKLKVSLNLNSQTSSNPPSTDLLKKSEKEKEVTSEEKKKRKRKPGGQPGHQGQTRKGFDRVDRYQVLKPESCPNCGSQEWNAKAV